MEQQLLKRRRKELGYTLDYIAKKIGVTEATVQRWESGNIKSLRQGRLIQLAEILEISPVTLMGWDSNTEKNTAEHSNGCRSFSVINPQNCDFENPKADIRSEAVVNIPDSYLAGHKSEDFFVIEINDDSMFPQYRNGDRVLILKQNTLDYSGQIAALLSNKSKIILRRVDKIGEEKISLIPVNPNIAPQITNATENENHKIIGIPKLLIRDL